MDPGEAAVLFGVVLLCLLLISGLMVSALWLSHRDDPTDLFFF